MYFTKFADHVLLAAATIKDKRERRINSLQPAGAPKEQTVRRYILNFRKWLCVQPAGALFMLLAVITIGQQAWEKFDLLDLYCYISDTVHTPQGAIERILGTKTLLDDLWHGLDLVEASGIDLDQWMATPSRH